MNVKSRGKRVLGWALGGGLAWALALFSGGMYGGLGKIQLQLPHASAGRVGDESGTLVGYR